MSAGITHAQQFAAMQLRSRETRWLSVHGLQKKRWRAFAGAGG